MSDETVILPKNRVIEFRIRTAIPEAASEEEILEWLRSELSGRPLSPSNPLVGIPVRAAGEPTFEDTGLYLHNAVEEVDGKLSVRTWTDPAPYDGDDADTKVEEMLASRPARYP